MNSAKKILIKQGFVFSPRPFSDLLALAYKKETLQIPPFFADQPFFEKKISPRFSLFTSGDLFNNNLISGYAFSENKLIYGEESQGDIHKYANSAGNFTYWQLQDGQLRICHDYFGMGSLFYFENDSFIIVSNRLHLAAIAIDQLKINYELNINYIHSLILFSYPFKDQSFNNDTPIRNLNYLDLNYYISMTENDIKLLARPKDELPDESSYKNLLQNGILEIKRNILNVYDFAKNKPLSLDLSGGKDSRIVLGACLNDNNADLMKKIKVYSHKVGTPEDLAIAITLATLFNLSFLDEVASPLTYLPCQTALQLFRSFFMGSYFRLPVNLTGAPSALGRTQNSLRLSGSCGELYRDYQNTYFSDQYGSTFKEVMEHIFATSGWKTALKEKDLAEMKIYVFSSFIKFYQMPLPVARQKFYEWSRLRKHFGLRLYNFFNQNQIFFPILSRNLYKACTLLDFEQMRSARLIYDVLKTENDLLPNIKFFHPWEFSERMSRFEVIPNKNLHEKFQARFRECANKYSISRNSMITNARINTAEQEKEILEQMLKDALNAISGKYQDLSKFTGTLWDIYYSYNKDSQEKARNMAARIFSLHDIFFPLNDVNLTLPD